MRARVEIVRLGAQGDGMARTHGGPLFVPFTLPDESVLAEIEGDRGQLVSLVTPSRLRVEPACRHFGVCGGCALQHLELGSYLDWKRDKVVEALRARRVEAEVAAILGCPPQARRRIVLSARRTASGMLLGYNRALSHTIFQVEECPISRPEIVASFAALRRLADLLATDSRPFRLTVTATQTGLDIAAAKVGRLGAVQHRAIIDFALAERFARLSIEGEVLIEPRKPVVFFDDVAVSPPPGAFLQASAAAEQAMADLVCEHLRPARRVADLFAGCGSFALRLARTAAIHAVESELAMLDTLLRAARATPALKPVTVDRRDLFRRPLIAAELASFDGIVFDPPRAGAEEQAKQIARSTTPLVAAVSCNPQTLARDIAILVGGGYAVKSVTPIDQFLWSPHVEAVALLEKPRTSRRRPM